MIAPRGLPPGVYVAETDFDDQERRIAEMFLWGTNGETDLCALLELTTHDDGNTGFRINSIRVS